MPTFRATARISHSALGGTGTNSWHAKTDGVLPVAAAALDAVAGVIHTFYTAIAPIYPLDAHINWDGMWQEVLTGDPSTYQGDDWSVTGQGGSAVMPPANAICVGWKTASGTRQGRGRTFLGPLEAACAETNGTPVPVILDLVRTSAQALVDASQALEAGGIAVVSGVGTGTAREITATATRDLFAVLRSRRD